MQFAIWTKYILRFSQTSKFALSKPKYHSSPCKIVLRVIFARIAGLAINAKQIKWPKNSFLPKLTSFNALQNNPACNFLQEFNPTRHHNTETWFCHKIQGYSVSVIKLQLFIQILKNRPLPWPELCLCFNNYVM